ARSVGVDDDDDRDPLCASPNRVGGFGWCCSWSHWFDLTGLLRLDKATRRLIPVPDPASANSNAIASVSASASAKVSNWSWRGKQKGMPREKIRTSSSVSFSFVWARTPRLFRLSQIDPLSSRRRTSSNRRRCIALVVRHRRSCIQGDSKPVASERLDQHRKW